MNALLEQEDASRKKRAGRREQGDASRKTRAGRREQGDASRETRAGRREQGDSRGESLRKPGGSFKRISSARVSRLASQSSRLKAPRLRMVLAALGAAIWTPSVSVTVPGIASWPRSQ
jgi:hypothetical protein